MAVDFKAIFSAQDKVSNTLKGINTQGSSLTRTMGKLATAAAGVFSVSKVVEYGKESVDALTTFEKSMSEVYTLLPQASEKALGAMTEHVKQFSKEMGTPTTETIPALYEALSSGVPEDTVFDFLEVANKAAIGGVTSLTTTVNGLTSVLNAYGTDVIDVGTASDVMFQAVKLGKTTFEELSNSLYNVSPTAAAANVKFQDISAALAAMTAQGVPTSVSTTQLRQALVELTKTGTDTDKTFRKVAGKSFKEFIASGGNLQGAFQLLEEYAKKSNLGINDLFSSVEAGSAVLSLTGKGTDMFTQAMDAMANAAGSTEAAYDTLDQSFSRKLDKMNAKLEVVKINIGGELLDAASPLIDFATNNMDKITGGMEDFFGFISNGISKIGPMLPKILSTIKSSVKGVWGVVSPVLSWVTKHPDLLSKAIATLGGVIIAKNVVQGISGMASSFGALAGVLTNPFALIITAVGAAIGFVAYEVYSSNKKLKKASLDEHFGSIALSVEDLEAAAQHIVRTEALGELETALSAFKDVSQYKASIEDAIKQINKYNWMVSIGMQLTPDQISSYKESIESFIDNCQNLIADQQYSINLVLGIFTNDDAQGTEIRSAVNTFYSNNYNDVAELGSKLQEAVNSAFEDGLLTVDESQVISDYMNQMASITEKIAGYEFAAKMETLSIKTDGTKLTAESFIELQKQINTELEGAISSYDEGLTLTISQYKMMLDEGAIDQTQYDQWVETATQNYLDSVSGMQLKAYNFQADTITKAYADELKAAFPELENLINENLNSAGTLYGKDLDDFYKSLSKEASKILDKGDMLALEEIFNALQPTQEDLKALANSYVEAGKLIPESLQNAIVDSASLGALVGSVDQMKTVMGQAIMDDKNVPMQTETYWNSVTDSLLKEIENPIKAELPIRLSITYSVKDDPLGLMNNTKLPTSDWHVPMAMPGYASGTTNALDAYVAGEKGPELILGAGGSTVFPTGETDRIINAFENSSFKSRYNAFDNTTNTSDIDSSERTWNININGKAKIQGSGVTKEELKDFLLEQIEPIILEIIETEEFEEGRLSHEF